MALARQVLGEAAVDPILFAVRLPDVPAEVAARQSRGHDGVATLGCRCHRAGGAAPAPCTGPCEADLGRTARALPIPPSRACVRESVQSADEGTTGGVRWPSRSEPRSRCWRLRSALRGSGWGCPEKAAASAQQDLLTPP